MLHTADSGANWQALPRLVEQHLFDVLWDDSQWIAVGDKGALLTAAAAGTQWADRSQSASTAWHTQVAGKAGRYALAGYGVTALALGQETNTKPEVAK